MTYRKPIALLSIFGLFAALLVVSGCGGGETPSADGDRAGADSPPAAESTPPPPPAPTEGDVAAAGGPDATEYRKAPDFTLENVAGGELALSSLKGKVVLIDFWATWCGPCRRGIPHLNDLYAEHRAEGFEILGLSVDRSGRGKTGKELVLEFMKKQRMDYTNLMATADVARAYGGIRSIPAAFLVDRQGRIRRQYVGLQPPAVFERDVKELLAESAVEDEAI